MTARPGPGDITRGSPTGDAAGTGDDGCADLLAARRPETCAIAARYGLAEPPDGYFAIEVACWNCREKTRVFYWSGVGAGRPAPEPWPAIVRVRDSKTAEASYVANGCILCDALQGAFFLPERLYEALEGDDDFLELHDCLFPFGPEEGQDPQAAT